MNKFRSFSIAAILVMLLAVMSVISYAGSSLPFDDVIEGSWYYESVDYCYDHKYVAGMSDTVFGTNEKVTRGQFVTMLAGIEHIDQSVYTKTDFTDIPEDSWYLANAVWASEIGVVSGYPDGRFGGDDNITREQLALMMFRYSQYRLYDTLHVNISDLDIFNDKEDVSAWSAEGLSWCVETGMISGMDGGMVDPRGFATRAQVAVILHKFDIADKGKSELAKNITLSKYFSEDMIIQRDDTINIWGFAPESQDGKKVRASLGGLFGETTVKEGKWMITLPGTLPANDKGLVLRVAGTPLVRQYSNILIGDVYFVIGQSNVYYPLSALYASLPGTKTTVPIDGNDNIRLFRNSANDVIDPAWAGKYPVRGTVEVVEDVIHRRGWMRTDADAPNFSALGYIFGKQINEKTGVPVGLVEVDASGCPLAAFTPNEIADAWNAKAVDDAHKFDFANSDGVYTENVVKLYQSRWVYNQLIYPLTNASTAGLLWYQGESDYINLRYFYGADGGYVNQFRDVMTYYRNTFANKDKDFPIYVIELPSIYKQPSPDYIGWAFLDFGAIRSDMGAIPTLLDNCYMCASADAYHDLTYANSLHPYCKVEQAGRAVDIAMKIRYGDGNIDYVAGPQFIDADYVGGKATVSFRYVGDKLTAVDDKPEQLLGFKVFANGEWKPASSAKIISKDQIEVCYDSGDIVGIRYNADPENYFTREPDCSDLNLCSSTYIPAIAFTDYK